MIVINRKKSDTSKSSASTLLAGIKKQKVGAKPLPKGQKKVTISLRLHPDTVLALDLLRVGRESRTAVIERAIASSFLIKVC